MEEEKQAPVEETVKVTQEEVKELNEEIETVEQGKLDEAKKEALNEVNPVLSELQKQLAELKAQNAAIEARQKAEAEEAAIKAEILKQQEYQNQINTKHVVAPSENPIVSDTVAKEPRLSTQEEWRLYEKNAGGNFASIDDLKE